MTELIDSAVAQRRINVLLDQLVVANAEISRLSTKLRQTEAERDRARRSLETSHGNTTREIDELKATIRTLGGKLPGDDEVGEE